MQNYLKKGKATIVYTKNKFYTNL